MTPGLPVLVNPTGKVARACDHLPAGRCSPFLSLLVLVCSIMAVEALRADDAPGRKMALVIGNNAYSKSLKNAVNDANSIGAALAASGFSVTLLTDAPLTTMGSTIDRFVAQAQTGDVVFFFYAGHGFQLDGENFLVPTDFSSQDPVTARYKAYPVSKLLDGLVAHKTRVNVVVLDACRNNPFEDKRGFQGGLAAMSSAAGTYIAYATSPNGTASDEPTGGHGLFTQALLANLTVPDLSLDQLFNNVRAQVYRQSGGQQMPWTASGLIDAVTLNQVQANSPARSAPGQSRAVATTSSSQSPPGNQGLLPSQNAGTINPPSTSPNLQGKPSPFGAGTPMRVVPDPRISQPPFPANNQTGNSSVVPWAGPEGASLHANLTARAPSQMAAAPIPPAPSRQAIDATRVRSVRNVSASVSPSTAAPHSSAAVTAPALASVPSLLTTAEQAIAKSDLTSAEAALLRALQTEPDNAHATILLGAVRLLQRHYPEGLANFNTAMQLAPLDPQPLYYRALTYGLLAQYDRALKDCDLGLKANPADTRFLIQKANILYVTGHLQDAMALCNQALAIDANLALAYLIRGNCEHDMGNTSAADADYSKSALLQARVA